MEISTPVRRVFFGRFGGRLTPIQEIVFQAFDGNRDLLVMAGTGSGKTEAVLAPLAQTFSNAPRVAPSSGTRALVVSPTRSLASDLYERMASRFADLGLRLDVKTSDRSTVGSKPSDVLIRTPEGIDGALCRRPDQFSEIGFVVIDELHKFLDGPRGSQLVGLFARIGRICPHHRRVGISATVADPTSPDRGKLLRDPAILEDPDERGTIELLFHQWLGKPELASSRFVAELRQLGVRKAIGFAGRKARVEELTQLLDRDYFRGRCFAHHADLSTSERRRTEEQLRQLPVGLVVATTTLEVGIRRR